MTRRLMRLRAVVEKVSWLLFPDAAAPGAGQNRPGRPRLAVPYIFSPNLTLGGALIAVAACLARIFSACALFAVWGTVSALAWSAIENRFWRAVAVLPLVLVFLAALAALMIAISTLERMIARKG